MKKVKSLINILVLFSLIFFASCASSPEKKIDSVYVMVYDRENSEVMNVTVFIDDEKTGSTDIYGRFMFPISEDDKKIHIVRIEKEDYETVSTETNFRPGQLLYFRIGSGTYYANLAEELLDRNEYEKALKMINRALKITDRKDWQFLRSIILGRIDK